MGANGSVLSWLQIAEEARKRDPVASRFCELRRRRQMGDRLRPKEEKEFQDLLVRLRNWA